MGQVRLLLLVQGAFYFLTGIWPILHMPSFLWVTGEKVDLWLVTTVGAVLAVNGMGFVFESRRQVPSVGVCLIAAALTATLIAIDIIYVSRQTISPVYLWDSAAELVLLLLWILSWKLMRTKQRTDSLG
jgi:hypothetical protein